MGRHQGHGSDQFADLSGLRSDVGFLLLALLLVVDVAVVALHLAHVLFGVPGGKAFDLGVDRSFGEFAMYIKLGWISILAAMLASRRRSPVFAAVAMCSLVLLVEDAFILHERVGQGLAAAVVAAFPSLEGVGILSIQVGELIWLAAVAAVLLIVLLVAYRHAVPEDRRDARSILLFFAVVGVLAIVVDSIHSVFAFGSLGDVVFTVLEDGGEMLALTPAVALTFALVVRERVLVSAE